MPKYNTVALSLVMTFFLLSGPALLRAKPVESVYDFEFAIAVIQGPNRGIMEMTGTASIASDSAIIQLKKARVAKSLTGETLFRPTDDRELMFQREGDGHWILKKGGTDAREFGDLLGLILGLHSLQATGKAPKAILATDRHGLVEQERGGWQETGSGAFLRESPHNGHLLKSSAKKLQGLKIGSVGQFDELKNQFAGDLVALPVLEDLVVNANTDHLQLMVVTLTTKL